MYRGIPCTGRLCLKSRGLATSVGDEGGFAPDLGSDEEAIEVYSGSDQEGRLRAGQPISFWQWMQLPVSGRGSRKGEYVLPKAGKKFTSEELVAHWKQLCEKYPIASIEDGLDEEDWEGWQHMTSGTRRTRYSWSATICLLPIPSACKRGSDLGCGNSILIKLNQIGSVSETLEAIKMAHKAGYTCDYLPPFRRDRGYHDRRSGGCIEYLPDQDRRTEPK